MNPSFKQIFLLAVIFILGITLGGLIFSRSLPRPFVDLARCHEFCFNKKEVLGLLASVGIQNLGDNLPTVILETDKTLVFDIQYPYPEDKIHYVVVPKRDIKDLGSSGKEDMEYLHDSFVVINNIIKENNYQRYRVITNGPGYQEVAYLHFHLVVDRDSK